MWAARKLTISDRQLFIMVGALVALAWVALWVWGQSPADGLAAQHPHHGMAGEALILVFFAGWTLMIVAMMLPTSLPLVMMFHGIARRRADAVWLVGLLIGGYLGVWTAFGAVVYLGAWALRELVALSTWVAVNAWLLGPAALMLAGLYQFTPLKYHCLDRCRSPFSFITERWHGRHARAEALWLGMHHGAFCLGWCWSLMLLMFVVGARNVGWMLALGAVMAVEKNVPRGRRLSAPLGVLLIGWGLAAAVTG